MAFCRFRLVVLYLNSNAAFNKCTGTQSGGHSFYNPLSLYLSARSHVMSDEPNDYQDREREREIEGWKRERERDRNTNSGLDNNGF
jgi:hypothetical protein